jgi:hypothetical protein
MEIGRPGRQRAGVRQARLAAARRPRPGAPALGHARPGRLRRQHPPVPLRRLHVRPQWCHLPAGAARRDASARMGAAAGRRHRQRAVLPPRDVAAGRTRRRHGRGDRRHDRRHIPALHDHQPERDLAGARRAVRDLVLRPLHGPGRQVAGARARRELGRGRRLLRPGVPGHRRRRSRGELRLAHARLDAAAVGSRAGHRPAHASHVRPADHGPVTGRELGGNSGTWRAGCRPPGSVARGAAGVPLVLAGRPGRAGSGRRC